MPVNNYHLNAFRNARRTANEAVQTIQENARTYVSEEIVRQARYCLENGIGTEVDGDVTVVIDIPSTYTGEGKYDPAALLTSVDRDVVMRDAEKDLQTYTDCPRVEIRRELFAATSFGNPKFLRFRVMFCQSPF